MAQQTTIPDFIFDLRPLVPLVSTLTTIASNPERWIKQNLGEFVVGQVFGVGQWMIGIFLEGVAIASGAITAAGDTYLSGLAPIGTTVRAIPGMIYEPIYQIALSGGFAAPIAAAIAAVIAVSMAILLLYVIAYAAASVIPGVDGVRGGIEAWRK